MSKRIEKILKFALEAENAVEKDAFIRSALVLMEESYPMCKLQKYPIEMKNESTSKRNEHHNFRPVIGVCK